MSGNSSGNKPIAKSELSASGSGNFDAFVERLLAVPHSEIKAQLKAKREFKIASRASGASPK